MWTLPGPTSRTTTATRSTSTAHLTSGPHRGAAPTFVKAGGLSDRGWLGQVVRLTTIGPTILAHSDASIADRADIDVNATVAATMRSAMKSRWALAMTPMTG